MNVNDLTFEPKAPKESIEVAGKWLEYNKNIFSSATNFIIVADDPKKTCVKLASQCHAGIQNSSVANGERSVVATEIAIDRILKSNGPAFGGKDKEVYFPFLKWFTQESHFSRFILNKDDWDFITSHGIIVSADIPSPLLQNIMIISRHFKECYTGCFEQFNKWLEKYPKAGALLFNICFCSSISNTIPTEGRPDRFVYSTGAAHRIVGLFPTIEELNNFCAGEYGDVLTDRKDQHYRNWATIYGGSKYGRKLAKGGELLTDTGSTFVHDLIHNHPDFKKELQKHRGVSKATPIIANPFLRKAYDVSTPTDSAICKLSEYDELILPYIISEGLIPSVI